jgi:hypothetical protein
METVWFGLGLLLFGAAGLFVVWPWIRVEDELDSHLDLGLGVKYPGVAFGFIVLMLLGLGLLVYSGLHALGLVG